MSAEDPLESFRSRVQVDWLPVYCADPKRQYSPDGFKYESIRLDPKDAHDCMRAIDAGVVKDVGHGWYRAARATAAEPLFVEGRRSTSPRPITLWLEPAITFAALARLHFDFGWPMELLANQPRSWAFDLAAHEASISERYRILGEVKKTAREAENLLADLRLACARTPTAKLRTNSAKKWKGLLQSMPSILWIIGPACYSKVFGCTYTSGGRVELHEATPEALQFTAA